MRVVLAGGLRFPGYRSPAQESRAGAGVPAPCHPSTTPHSGLPCRSWKEAPRAHTKQHKMLMPSSHRPSCAQLLRLLIDSLQRCCGLIDRRPSEAGAVTPGCSLASGILRTQSLEWYYNNVKSRFKRFGSAKVLKTLYRKHIVERGGLSELPEGSVHEGSIDNEGSVCGSDSTFYRQSEEAIEEAIAKAEEYSDSLEKQNEARYLRDNKEELIEELATTIVQKIIQRRKRSEMQAEYEMVWPSTQNQSQTSELPSPTQPQPSPQTAQPSLKTSYSLWRSRSAFSLTSDDSPEKPTEPEEKAESPEGAGRGGVREYASLKKEARTSQITSWKSASAVLQSPDGNWIALQSTQLSRPSLLTKRKSLVYSVLEKESGVVSAYDEMGSDTEDEDPGGWIAALHEFRRKMSDETYYTDSQHDPEWTYTQNPPVTSPSSGQYTNTETLNSDSESSSVPSSARDGQPKHRKPLLSLLKRKGAPEHHHYHPPHPHQMDALDINFNPKVAGGGLGVGPGDSSEAEDRPQNDQVRRSRRRRKSKREQAEPSRAQQALYSSSVPEYSNFSLSSMARRELEAAIPPPSAYPAPDTVTPDTLTSEAVTPNAGSQDGATPSSQALSTADALELELKSKLCELVRRTSDKELTSSEEELRAAQREAEREAARPEKKEREKACDKKAEKQAKVEEERLKDKILERGGQRLEKKESERGEGRIAESEKEVSREMQREEVQRLEKREGASEEARLGQTEEEAEVTGATHSSHESAPCVQEEILSAEDIRKKYSAASLCNITTEVLKVLNATEELIEEAGGEGRVPSEPTASSPLPSSSSTKKLDEQLTKLEENGELGDLEECARAISSSTTEKELAFLEDQVASAAAQVQQSELQISDIEARISALKTAGLNVAPCSRFSKFKPKPKPQTIGSSRQQRRKLPAPPLKVTATKMKNRNRLTAARLCMTLQDAFSPISLHQNITISERQSQAPDIFVPQALEEKLQVTDGWPQATAGLPLPKTTNGPHSTAHIPEWPGVLIHGAI
ncbi:hypothetical protein JZ751_004040 [Albula glossodonta]|uniref:Rab effector MyRIP/Melanophilin domain-containing protein n=1 Tax=Albula glossodonta TaxID=121402 RepID=A0A8T2P7Z2_9TELE|nr:hypothetical protein JZ751_004040 [Albula glossodonta]